MYLIGGCTTNFHTQPPYSPSWATLLGTWRRLGFLDAARWRIDLQPAVAWRRWGRSEGVTARTGRWKREEACGQALWDGILRSCSQMGWDGMGRCLFWESAKEGDERRDATCAQIEQQEQQLSVDSPKMFQLHSPHALHICIFHLRGFMRIYTCSI